jgi:hypothetical protein
VIADNVRVAPFAGAANGSAVTTLTSGSNTHAKALVTVDYKSKYYSLKDNPNNPNVPEGTYLSYSAELGAEYLTNPARTWMWENLIEQVPGDHAPGILVPTETYTLTWSKVTRPPRAAIRNLRGKISSSTFLGAPAGCTLFLGAAMSRDFQVEDEVPTWRLEYRFAEKVNFLKDSSTAVGWNYFYNSKPDGSGEHWQRIVAAVSVSGNEYPYQTGNFNALFQYE